MKNIVNFPCIVCPDLGIEECLGSDCPAANGRIKEFEQALVKQLDKEIPCKDRRTIVRIGASYSIIKPN